MFDYLVSAFERCQAAGGLQSALDRSKAARDETRVADTGEALYLSISNKHKVNRVYIGKANDVTQRLAQWAAVDKSADGDQDIWIGVIVSQGVAGKPTGGPKFHSPVLTITERTLIYFLQPSENTNLRKSPPENSAMIINRWFEPKEPYARKFERGHPDWPDFIEYDRENETASLVWFGSKRVERIDVPKKS